MDVMVLRTGIGEWTWGTKRGRGRRLVSGAAASLGDTNSRKDGMVVWYKLSLQKGHEGSALGVGVF